MTDLSSLVEHAERAVSRVPLPSGGLERLQRRRDRRRRNERIAAGVVGITVFAAAVWIVTTGGPFDRTQTPAATGAVVRKGFIGIPPRGAAPSTPVQGELLLSLYGGTTSGPRSKVYAYADRRLIWQAEAGYSYGANVHSTGFLEQRLTSEGVELQRSEIISTGLFGDDLALGMARPIPFLNFIEVRNGDRLVRVSYHQDYEGWRQPATPEQRRALLRLEARLADPASWLPASAWEDRAIRAYVPSMFEVCYGGDPFPIEPSRILTLLPGSAGDLLRAKVRETLPTGTSCSDMTTDQARALAEALGDGGLEPYRPESWCRLEYRFETAYEPLLATTPDRTTVFIGFEPYLPHGEVISLCGG